MATVTLQPGDTGLIQFNNVADPFGPAQIAEVRNRYQWTLQFGPTANASGGIVGTTLSNLTGGATNSNGVGFYIKATDIPRATIETQVLNQYNIRRNINTHVVYEPIQMTFYDTIDNAFLSYLTNYLNFKFMNWNNAQNVRAPFQLGPGLTPEFGPNAIVSGFGGGGYINGVGLGDFSLASTQSDNFCSYITITKEMSSQTGTTIPTGTTPYTAQTGFDIMGNPTSVNVSTQSPATASNTDKSQQITIYNPKIAEISQDHLDYADGSNVLTWTITWRYESFAYGPPQTPSYTASAGIIANAARSALEIGRDISSFFTDTVRRVF